MMIFKLELSSFKLELSSFKLELSSMLITDTDNDQLNFEIPVFPNKMRE